MKRIMLLAIVMTSTFAACTTLKPGTIGNGELSQVGAKWELNYIPAPIIAFNGL
jgi:heat shock protein HslJ